MRREEAAASVDPEDSMLRTETAGVRNLDDFARVDALTVPAAPFRIKAM